MAKERRSKYAKAEHKDRQQQRKGRASKTEHLEKFASLSSIGHWMIQDNCLFIKTQFLMSL